MDSSNFTGPEEILLNNLLEGKLAVLSERLQREGQRNPNMTHPSVPIGSEDVASIRK
jgi:hypothetical protein